MYSEEQKVKLMNEICSKISEGQAVRNVLVKYKGMPKSPTFFNWLYTNENFSKQYVRACEERAALIFEEMMIIADDQEGDTYIDHNDIEQVNHNVINRARLRIDTRKWMLSKLQPKVYGDKLQVDNISSDKSEGTQKLLASCSPKALDQIKKIIKYGEILSIENGVEVFNKSLPE